ncbi:MAG: hypothetical protein V7638_5087 [Acidobacteriota bacterium]|jgi:hypothetical protein
MNTTTKILLAALMLLAWTASTQAQRTPETPESILASFVQTESQVRAALTQHTFTREVVLQTIGPQGEVTGQYIRHSQFLFDDRGNRIERVTYHPPSTIREMRITKEDIQDLAGGQLLGVDITESAKYQLTYAGQETLAGKLVYRLSVEPAVKPNPHCMSERFFRGSVWVDAFTHQIVKVRGKVEPDGKQRFPTFETWRERITPSLSFPIRTEADDVLHFQNRDVTYRIRVKYYDYKVFASTVAVKEIEGPEQPEVCVTNRNAPPVNAYYWPPDTNVNVYFKRGMFTAEQRSTLLAAMKTWSDSAVQTDAGISFSYAGDTDGLATCKGCLTVSRREVYRNDRKHYAFFNPLQTDSDGLLVSAWIDFDFATTKPQALQGFMAHELGHGMGLWDCETCRKKKTIMNGFPGINKDNGLIAPSTCDLEVVNHVYQLQRRIDKNASKEGNK